ncbi:unnamed protein product, partial [Prorocentrum cordatum]
MRSSFSSLAGTLRFGLQQLLNLCPAHTPSGAESAAARRPGAPLGSPARRRGGSPKRAHRPSRPATSQEPLTTVERFRMLCAGEEDSPAGPAAHEPRGDWAPLGGRGPVAGGGLREALRRRKLELMHLQPASPDQRGLPTLLGSSPSSKRPAPTEGGLREAVPRKGRAAPRP